jgi:hypothetical protein
MVAAGSFSMIPGVRSVRKEKDRSRKNRGEREMVDLSDELRTRKNIVCYIHAHSRATSWLLSTPRLFAIGLQSHSLLHSAHSGLATVTVREI